MAKQVIVMRKDLNMRKGKMVAQGGHAVLGTVLSMGSILKSDEGSLFILEIPRGSALEDWLNGPFTKICVSVNSEQELLDIVDKAKAVGLPVKLITDAGKTEFNGVPTHTCCAIGPEDEEKIDAITGNLPLL